MYLQHTIAVVVPAHNEESLIATTLRSIPAFVDRIIVIDDGSSDQTLQSVLNVDDGRIFLIKHAENRGVGAATISGYQAALRLNIDVIAVMDGDGQMHPDDLTGLLDAVLIDGKDYVKGNRFLHASIECMPMLRYLGNQLFSRLMKIAAGLDRSIDAQCGYSAIKSETLRRLDLTGIYPRYGFLNEVIFQIAALNRQIGSVPVRTIYGDEISGINPFITVPKILMLIARGYLRRLYRKEVLAAERTEISKI